MTVALLISWGIIWPRRWPTLIGPAVAVVDVRLVAMAAIVAVSLALRRGRPVAGDEVAFLSGLAAQLRAGNSIRLAIVEVGSASSLGLEGAVRLASAGRSIDDVVTRLRPRLPISGTAVGMALSAGSLSGGRLATALDAIVQLVFDEAELKREVGAASAAARASAWLIFSIPLVGMGVMVASGRLATLAGLGTAGWIMVALGSGLLLAGATAMAGLARSVRQ